MPAVCKISNVSALACVVRALGLIDTENFGVKSSLFSPDSVEAFSGLSFFKSTAADCCAVLSTGSPTASAAAAIAVVDKLAVDREVSSRGQLFEAKQTG